MPERHFLTRNALWNLTFCSFLGRKQLKRVCLPGIKTSSYKKNCCTGTRGLFMRVCLKSHLSSLFFFGSEPTENRFWSCLKKVWLRKHCHYNTEGCSWKFFVHLHLLFFGVFPECFLFKSQFGSFVGSRTKPVY